MIQYGRLASAVTGQSARKKQSLAGFRLCFVESLPLPGVCLISGGRRVGFVIGYQSLRALLKGGFDGLGDSGGALMVACQVHI